MLLTPTRCEAIHAFTHASACPPSSESKPPTILKNANLCHRAQDSFRYSGRRELGLVGGGHADVGRSARFCRVGYSRRRDWGGVPPRLDRHLSVRRTARRDASHTKAPAIALREQPLGPDADGNDLSQLVEGDVSVSSPSCIVVMCSRVAIASTDAAREVGHRLRNASPPAQIRIEGSARRDDEGLAGPGGAASPAGTAAAYGYAPGRSRWPLRLSARSSSTRKPTVGAVYGEGMQVELVGVGRKLVDLDAAPFASGRALD